MFSINLDGFKATPLKIDPYQYLIVPNFLVTTAITAIDRDYPRIEKAGSFPLETLSYGKAFSDLIEELKGPEIRQAFEEKFHTDLKNKPTLIKKERAQKGLGAALRGGGRAFNKGGKV